MIFFPQVFMSVEHGSRKQKCNSCIWQGSSVHPSFTAINFDAHKIYTFNINHALSPVSTVT
jgi:hypothetical protein